MHMSNRGPMLGTLTVERWGKRHRRNDRPTDARIRQGQKRAARIFERAFLVAEIEAIDLEIAEEREWALDFEPGYDAETPPTGCYHATRNGGYYS